MLLSVHPRHATSILGGGKTVELRRQRVAVPAGTSMVLYATSPTKAIIGTVTITDIHIDTPRRVWTQYRRRTGITRSEYDSYMAGAAQASAIVLASPRQIATPIPLSFLRSSGSFQPPQSYRYIGPKELWELVAGHASADELMSHLGATVILAR